MYISGTVCLPSLLYVHHKVVVHLVAILYIDGSYSYQYLKGGKNLHFALKFCSCVSLQSALTLPVGS